MTYTLLSGFILSCTYLLIAVGFVLILKVADIVNMAYGAFVVLGMYTVYVLVDHGLPYGAAVSIAPLIGAVFAAVLYVAVIGRTRKQGHRQQIVITALALSVIEVVLQLFFGADPRLLSIRRTGIQILGVSIQREQVIAAIVALVCAGGLFATLRYTRFGKVVEAAGAYEDSARSLGLSVERIFGVVFVLGTAMAFLAGALMSGYTPIDPYLSLDVLIVAILIALVGRLTFTGAVCAALCYGLGYSVFVKLTANPGLSNVLVLATMLGFVVVGGVVNSMTRVVRRA